MCQVKGTGDKWAVNNVHNLQGDYGVKGFGYGTRLAAPVVKPSATERRKCVKIVRG